MRLFIASVIVLLGILLFVFALFPSEISVNRMALIDGRQDSVSRKLSDLSNWTTWNVLLADSSNNGANKFILGKDPYRLQSPRLTIFMVKASGDTIITRWVAGNGKLFNAVFVLTPSGKSVAIQWSLNFHLRWYPWEKMASMFYDKQLGPLMEQSLTNFSRAMPPA